MNTNEEFLDELLNYHSLTDNSPEVKALVAEGVNLHRLLDEKFDPMILHKREGGSKAKGTMVKSGFDYDLGLYVDANDNSLGDTLEEIADNAIKHLSNYYELKEKTIAIQLVSKAKDRKGQPIGIDLVIGRFEDASRTNAWVTFRGKEKERLKTNIITHVNHVRYSGCIDIIKSMKIWKLSRGLTEIKTFPIELATIEILKSKEAPGFGRSDRLAYVFAELARKAETIVLEDPANPNGNNIERVFGKTERILLRDEVEHALSLYNGGGWQQVFGEIPTTDPKARALLFTAGAGSLPAIRPWTE